MTVWSGDDWNDDRGPTDALYRAIGRSGVQRVRPPRGAHLGPALERAIVFVGSVVLTAAIVGGVFFWIGVIQGIMGK